MENVAERLLEAELLARKIFDEALSMGIIQAGKTEKEINSALLQLSREIIHTDIFWHKRIVRSGPNTLLPYHENPPDRVIENDDILFFDFGPVLKNWEADIGITHVIGENPEKIKLKSDTELAWSLGKEYMLANYNLSGAEVYKYISELAREFGWEYGNEHCGHLIGEFPHEKIQGEEKRNYLHPDNHSQLSEPDLNGKQRYWILEIHFVDKQKEIGGFYEGFIGLPSF